MEGLPHADLCRYLLHLIEAEERTAAFVNQVINAFRFLYVEVYGRQFALGEIPRPRKERKLPTVLSLREVKQILEATGNIKHRCLLRLVYSAGLRAGEVVQLELGDIDPDRMMIHVRGAKGKKDRYSILSPVAWSLLEEYRRRHLPRGFVFEGQQSGRPYSDGALRKCSKMPSGRLDCGRRSPFTHWGMRSQHICWNKGRTFASFRNSWVTAAPRPRRSTRM